MQFHLIRDSSSLALPQYLLKHLRTFKFELYLVDLNSFLSKVGKESKEVTVSCFINHGSGDKIPSLNDNENDEEIAVGTVSILYEIVGISEVRFTLKNPNQYIGQRKKHNSVFLPFVDHF